MSDSQGCYFGVYHWIGITCYVALTVVGALRLYMMRTTNCVVRRSTKIILIYQVQLAVSGTIELFGVLCGNSRSIVHIFAETMYEYVHIPALMLLVLLRMVFFLESDMRNQGYLLLNSKASAPNNTDKQPYTFSRAEHFLLRVLGLNKTVRSSQTTRSERLELPAKRWLLSIIINVSYYLFVYGMIASIFQDFKDEDLYFGLHLGLIVATVPYTLYLLNFLWRMLHIQDPYFIRAELFATALLILTIASIALVAVVARINFLPLINTGTMISLIFLANLILQIFGLVFIHAATINRTKEKKNYLATAMPFAEFAIQLSNVDFLAQLKPQLARDFCMENALFIEEFDNAAVQLKSALLRSSEQQPQDSVLASYLYYNFLATDSPHELNIPMSIKSAVELARAANALQVSDFLEVRNHVAISIYENTYPRFLRSETARKPRPSIAV